MAGKLTSFWNYLKDHEKGVKVPIIQRDYAQGREEETEKRKRFLDSLHKALSSNDTLKLDFVYGTTVDNAMQPLDGQQRLTTLWLLHWYFSAKARLTGENTEASRVLKKFSYETRSSSRDFCERLSEFQPWSDEDQEKPKNNDKNKGDSSQTQTNGNRQVQTARTGDAHSAPTILFKRPKPNKSDETTKEPNIAERIKKQTWFNSAWIQDPTISGMLRMLSGDNKKDEQGNDIIVRDNIEAVFGNIASTVDEWKNAWDGLCDPETCPILFYELDMGEYGLTDDLYIKMNARGEQLSACENFKADLLGYIQRESDKAKRSGQENPWEEFLDIENGIAAKWDNDWTNIFWKKRLTDASNDFGKKWANRVDEIFLAFINRFWFNHIMTLDVDEANYSAILANALASHPCYSEELRYDSFDYYEKLKYRHKNENGQYHAVTIIEDCEVAKAVGDLIKILDNYPKIKDFEPKDVFLFSPWRSADDTNFIPEYGVKEEPTNYPIKAISQPQRVVFFAICKFLIEMPEDLTDENEIKRLLKRWMRVVWNLVSVEDADGGSAISTVDMMRTAIKIIDILESHSIYKFLCEHPLAHEIWRDFVKTKNSSGSVLMLQLQEEINKAQRISDVDGNLKNLQNGERWEDVIEEAEQYAFFHGAIRFIFQTDANGKSGWDESAFNTRFKNLKEYFCQNGVKESYRKNAKLLRAFLAREADIDWFRNNKAFWRNEILLSGRHLKFVSLLVNGAINENNYMPCKNIAPWILDETLISDAIYGGGPENLKWHILHWRDVDVLTTYKRQEQGNVTKPHRVIPLNRTDQRYITVVNFLNGMESPERRGNKYFIGWTENINFKYSDHWFRWRGAPKTWECDVYLLEGDAQSSELATGNTADENTVKKDAVEFYCFDVKDMNAGDFKNELDKLIESFKKDQREKQAAEPPAASGEMTS